MDLNSHYVQKCNLKTKLCYGLGHALNDLCAAIWFSYTLFFLQIIVTLDASTAGLFVMIGQVADALTTPLAGFIVDRTKGTKAWYIAGTLAVVIGFAMFYCAKPEYVQMSMTAYYLTFVIVFQIGWALVQISHLSVLPIISTDKACSNELTAIRHTASICCNIIVYVLTWAILQYNNDSGDDIGPKDYVKFMIIAIIILAIGITTTIIYCIGVNYELNDLSQKEADTNATNPITNASGSDNFCTIMQKSLVVYFVSVMYMCARLYNCLTLLYIPLYLYENANLIGNYGGGLRGAIAIVPFILFVCSFFATLCLKYLNKIFKNLVIYVIGAGLSLAACLWIVLDNGNGFYARIAVNVALMGVGNSMTMVSSLCMTANYVKVLSMKSGIVYSAVTFTDKLITGVVVYLIQSIDCVAKGNCNDFYSRIFYVCGLTPCVGVVALVFLSLSLRFLKINR